MATQYFRITAYHPAEDLSAILDSNGRFEKIWQFSSLLISKGFQIVEVSNDERFLDGTIGKAETAPDKLFLRAHKTGKPENISHAHNDIAYRAVKVADAIYIPDRERRA